MTPNTEPTFSHIVQLNPRVGVAHQLSEDHLLPNDRHEWFVTQTLIDEIFNREIRELQLVRENFDADSTHDGITRIHHDKGTHAIQKVELRRGSRKATVLVLDQDVLYGVSSFVEEFGEQLPPVLRDELVRIAWYGDEFKVQVLDLVR